MGWLCKPHIHLVQSHLLFSHSLPALAGHSIGSPCQLFELETPGLGLRALAPALDRSVARNPRSSPIVSQSGKPCTAIMTDAATPTQLLPSLVGTSPLPPSHWTSRLMTEY